MGILLLALALLLTFFMFTALDILSFSLKRSGWQRFLTSSLLLIAQIISTEFMLGAIFALYSYSLAICNIVISAGIIFILYKKHGVRLFNRYIKNILIIPSMLKNFARQDMILATMYVFAGGFLVWILFLGLIFPALDWDGNAYHLTYAANMVQSHAIFDQPTNLVWVPAYPKGAEFIQAWTILLAHTDWLVDLTQVPFMILGVIALYGIAVSVGVSKKNARYTSLLFFFVPSALNQLTTAYIDVMLATTFFAVLALILQKTYTKIDYLLIGIAFSFLISLKASGIFMVAALLTFLLIHLYREYGVRIRYYFIPAILVVSPMFFGLYWYIKNLVLYGSPIYPFGYEIAGKQLFGGVDYEKWSSGISANMPDNNFARWWHTWSEHAPNPEYFVYNYDSSYFGLGPIWFVILVPAIILTTVLAIKKQKYYILATFLFLFALLWIFPVNFSPRYTLFIFAAGVIGLGFVLDNIKRASEYLAKTSVLVMAVFTLSINFMLWSYPPAVVANQIKSIYSGQGQHGPTTLFPLNFGPAYALMHNTVQKDETIVYTSGHWIYPLWNDQFSNDVIFIEAQNEEDWYKQVKANGADYVFTATEPTAADYVFAHENPKHRENVWAKKRFTNVIYKDAAYEVYKVN